MIRARFMVNGEDYRPVNWPIKHPYWCSGYEGGGRERAVIVAYADDEAEIMRNWPDAEEIDAEPRDSYTFTDRFARPEWFQMTPAADPSDVERRLRQHALPDPFDEREVMHAPLLTEAADAITRLREQVAALNNALAAISLTERDRTSSDTEKVTAMAKIAREEKT